MLFAYQMVICGILLLLLLIVLLNRHDFLPVPDGSPHQELPMISVLVPARNEERNIERCIRSLMQQSYPCYEIIVLDDGSADATSSIVKQLQQSGGECVRLVEGAALPAGWHGKSWACYQLSQQARGAYLLFTDADTVHAPDSLFRSASAMQAKQAAMLSLAPAQETGSFAESLIVPLVYFVLASFLPTRLVSRSRNPAFSFANGQYIMFSREGYDLIGGHRAVRKAIVEDVWLCMAVKKQGGLVIAHNGMDLVRCRMYRSFHEVWSGFSKNIYAAMGYRRSAFLGMTTLTTAMYVVPPLWLLAALLEHRYTVEYFWLPLLQLLIAWASRFFVARQFKQALPVLLLHPVSWAILMAISWNSFLSIHFGRGAEWKGRRYDFS